MDRPSIFSTLPSFTGVTFFGLEELHMFGQGIAKHVYELLTTAYRHNTCHKLIVTEKKKFPFFISKISLLKIDALVNLSRETIPSTYDSKWKNPVVNIGGIRGVDWLDIFLHMVPTLFVPALVNKAAQRPLMCLVRACSLVLKWEVDEATLRLFDS